MRVRLVAVGDRMPAWVRAGVEDYVKRLPREWHFELVEIPLAARGKNPDIARLKDAEGQRLLRAVPERSHLIALDERGKELDSPGWAAALKRWQHDGRDIALLVGGPDGLSGECLSRAGQQLSLSKATLPHALVRVLVVEQLYRAWSLLGGHPYHRA